MINAKGFTKMCYATIKEHPEFNYWDVKEMATLLMERHQPIKEYLNSGIGLELQNCDSQIADKVLFSLADKDIPCIPVHDSFIVQRKYEEELRESMENAYFEVVGEHSVIESK